MLVATPLTFSQFWSLIKYMHGKFLFFLMLLWLLLLLLMMMMMPSLTSLSLSTRVITAWICTCSGNRRQATNQPTNRQTIQPNLTQGRDLREEHFEAPCSVQSFPDIKRITGLQHGHLVTITGTALVLKVLPSWPKTLTWLCYGLELQTLTCLSAAGEEFGSIDTWDFNPEQLSRFGLMLLQREGEVTNLNIVYTCALCSYCLRSNKTLTHSLYISRFITFSQAFRRASNPSIGCFILNCSNFHNNNCLQTFVQTLLRRKFEHLNTKLLENGTDERRKAQENIM